MYNKSKIYRYIQGDLVIFWGLKRYRETHHRHMGKVKKIELFMIITFRSNCNFSVGGKINLQPAGVGLESKQIRAYI